MASPQRLLWIFVLVCSGALAAPDERCRLLLPFAGETHDGRAESSEFAHLSRARDYPWEGERPSEALWANTRDGGGQYFLDGTVFERLTFRRLAQRAEAANHAHFSFGQAFLPISPDEIRLLGMSTLDTQPHEVAQLVIHTEQERLLSSVIHGRRRAVSGRAVRELLEHSLAQVRALYPARGLVELEIVHTHPVANFYEQNPGERGRSARVHGLSPGDIKNAIALSKKYPTSRVRIRAVLPEGITFEKVFLDGRDVTRRYAGRGR